MLQRLKWEEHKTKEIFVNTQIIKYVNLCNINFRWYDKYSLPANLDGLTPLSSAFKLDGTSSSEIPNSALISEFDFSCGIEQSANALSVLSLHVLQNKRQGNQSILIKKKENLCHYDKWMKNKRNGEWLSIHQYSYMA